MRWSYGGLAALSLASIFFRMPVAATAAVFLFTMASHAVAVSLIRRLESPGCSCHGSGGVRMGIAAAWPPLMLFLNTVALALTLIAAAAAAGSLAGCTAGSAAGSLAGSAMGSAIGSSMTSLIAGTAVGNAARAAKALAGKAVGKAVGKAARAAKALKAKAG